MDMSGQLLVSRPSTLFQPLRVAYLDVNRREAKDENRNEPPYTQTHTKTKPNVSAIGVMLTEQIHSVVDPHKIIKDTNETGMGCAVKLVFLPPARSVFDDPGVYGMDRHVFSSNHTIVLFEQTCLSWCTKQRQCQAKHQSKQYGGKQLWWWQPQINYHTHL